MNNDWPRGWSAIVIATQASAIEVELKSEVGPGHVLFGEGCTALATNYRDDYLFGLSDGRLACVHLTFARRRERPPWPGTTIYERIEDWRNAIEAELREAEDDDDPQNIH